MKFLDNPTSKTVIAVFSNNSSIIITDMSGDNYTNPPGYMKFNLTQQEINTIRVNLSDRINQFKMHLTSMQIISS